jgi:hypothetical protein
VEPKSSLTVLDSGITLKEKFPMRSKIILTALVAASLAGSTIIAAAQNQPAPGASGQGEVGPGSTKSKMKSGKETTGSAMKGKMKDPNAMPNSDATGQGTVGPDSKK